MKLWLITLSSWIGAKHVSNNYYVATQPSEEAALGFAMNEHMSKPDAKPVASSMVIDMTGYARTFVEENPA